MIEEDERLHWELISDSVVKTYLFADLDRFLFIAKNFRGSCSVRIELSLNSLVFYTSRGISSSLGAFLFLIFLCTESSSSWVNGPGLMSNCLLIILVIGSYITFGGFPSKFSKCCFHSCFGSSWLVAFSLAFAVLFLLLTSFTVCHAILDCPSSTEFLIFLIWFCMYSVWFFR